MKIVSFLTAAIISISVLFSTSSVALAKEEGQTIVLSCKKSGENYSHSATLDGEEISEYDYVWHVDPKKEEPYYTGDEPEGDEAVYITHDIFYYPELEQEKFKKVSYDGENEWVYFYEAEGLENYIFSTLPVLKTGFPSQMMHSESEAYQNAVLNITKAGTYTLKGDWHGQIRVDLGEESFDDPTQKVKLILDGANIECTVAAGLVFAEVYECDNTWEEREEYSYSVDTKEAGAVIYLADGSENNISGSNIFRLLKPKYKDDDSTDTYPAQKKLLKVDGALYSYRSMNIEGNDGVLNVSSGFEGMGSELHLTINGGAVNVNSQDDGINVNEDGVSVLTVNGGNLHICAGLGAEGDGIDSNGYLVINSGTVISSANPAADSGMDSDKGSYVFGGNVVSLGSTMDWAKGDEKESSQAILNLRFSAAQSADEAIIITDTDDKVLFAYDPDKDEAMGKNSRTYSGAVISSPALKVGETVHIFVGGDVSGKEVNGVYDASTIKKFSGSSKQGYSGNTVGGFGGGFGGGKGQRPEGEMPHFSNDQMPQRPEGEMPDFSNGQAPQIPQGGSMQGGFAGEAGGALNEKFELSQTVNAFSGVADLTGAQTGTNAFNLDLNWLVCLLFFIGGAVFASLIFTLVILIKKLKKA